MSKTSTRQGKAKSTKSEMPGSGVLPMFAIACSLLIGYHFLIAPSGEAKADNVGPAKSIIVVDSKAVLQAFMEKKELEIAAGATYSEGEIKLSGAEFAAEYLRAIKKYRDAGYLVIDKKYALGVPEQSEITMQIADRLNLDVQLAPDPFSAPALQ